MLSWKGVVIESKVVLLISTFFKKNLPVLSRVPAYFLVERFHQLFTGTECSMTSQHWEFTECRPSDLLCLPRAIAYPLSMRSAGRTFNGPGHHKSSLYHWHCLCTALCGSLFTTHLMRYDGLIVLLENFANSGDLHSYCVRSNQWSWITFSTG
jgi:hypothetical protein